MINSPNLRFDWDIVMADQTFRLETQKQLRKDFASCQMFFSADFDVSVVAVYEILEQVEHQLVKLMENGERHLLQLLYIIDLPETEFLKSLSDANFLKILTQKVVYREAYKVWLRANYSS